MPPMAEEVARARSLAALTAAACAWPEEQLEAAEQLADRLGFLAASILDADGAVPDCGQPACTLTAHPAGRSAVRLAPLLAAARPVVRRAPLASASELDERDVAVLHRQFVQGLRDVGPVVYCCRRVLHTSGRCFFDDQGPGSGLCGRVLVVSHQVEHELMPSA